MRKNFLKLLCLSLILSFPVFVKAAGECTQETIADCYQEAKELYQDHNYPEAKTLFENVVLLDASYKQATSYLKKCQKQMDKSAPDSAATPPPSATTQTPETPVPPQQSVMYHVGVGDVLDVSVWRNPDLDKTVIVRPDGVISYPLVGDVRASGLSLIELDDVLTKRLKDFIRNPQVSVAIQRFGGVKVIVLGEVKGPGVYAVPGGGNIIDVIAMAGGFTNDGVRKGTLLVRGGIAQPQVYRLNLARVFKGDLGQNIAIASNDIIYVPKKWVVNVNYVITQLTPLLSNVVLGTTAEQLIRGSIDGVARTQ